MRQDDSRRSTRYSGPNDLLGAGLLGGDVLGTIALALIITGCSDAATPGHLEHPRAELVASLEYATSRVYPRDHWFPERLPAVAGTDLDSQPRVWEGSVLPAALDGLILGHVADASFFGDQDRLLVLDSYYHTLHLIEQNGATVASVGDFGVGPGAWQRPIRLSLLDDTTVAVIDRDARISLWTVARDSIMFRDDIRIDGSLRDACVIGDEVVLHGRHSTSSSWSRIVSLASGDVVDFPRLYIDDNPAIEGLLSRMMVSCDPDRHVALVVPYVLPRIWAFSLDGDPLWEIRLDGFLSPMVAETPLGISIQIPADGHHTATSVLSDAETGEWLVDYHFVGRDPVTQGGRSLVHRALLISADGIDYGGA